MPIEFPCTSCGRLLRTPDETAGRQAKCPSCGSVQPIPGTGETPSPPSAAGPESSAAPAAVPPGTDSGPPSLGTSPFAKTLPHGNEPGAPPREPGSPFSIPAGTEGIAPADSDNPYRAPAHEMVDVAPTYRPESFEPIRIDVGEVVSDAWSIYSTHLGTCVLVGLIVYALQIAMMVGVFAVFFAMAAAAGAAGQGFNAPEVLLVVLLVFGMIVGSFLIAWIYIGQTIFLLQLARGESPSIGVVFSGARHVLPVVLASILWSLASGLGMVACIVPGVILYLMLSQFYMLIIDRGVGIIESLKLSARITNGNKVALLLLVLLAIGAGMVAAFVPCGIGQMFATPLIALLWITAYLRMTGQSPTKSLASTLVI